MERLNRIPRRRMRRHEIGRRIREAERCKLATLHGLRRRERAARCVARHVAKHGPIASAGADEKAIRAVGADERLLTRSHAAPRPAPWLACAARADRRRRRSPAVPGQPVPPRPAPLPASDAGPAPVPRRLPRSPQARSARRRALAPPAQGRVRVRSGPGRDRRRNPARGCRASRGLRPHASRAGAKLGSCSRNPRATFGPAAAMNFAALSRSSVCSGVRCRSMAGCRAASIRKVQNAAGQHVALDFRRAAIDRHTPCLQERRCHVDLAEVRRDRPVGERVAARCLDQQAR